MAEEDGNPDEYQGSLETARAAGYSWADINNHVNTATATAADYGYTQSEINYHLGLRDPVAFEHQSMASWAAQMAADPKTLDDMEQGKIDLAGNPTMRSAYVEALKNGEVKGPMDFAERYGAQAVGAAHDIWGLDDTGADAHLAAASRSANEIAPTLPTREDLADATVALSPKTNFNTQSAQGMVKPGNVDPWNRAVLRNPDGGYSTTSSMSIGTDEGEVLIPTVIDGKRMTEGEAIAHFRETGENLGTFDTPQDADAYAESLHNAQAAQRDIRGNLLDNWRDTGQKPVDAVAQAQSDAALAAKLMSEEFADPLGPAIRGVLKAMAGTVIGLEHIGEAAFGSLAKISGSEGLQDLVTSKTAEWKAREDSWNAALKGGPASDNPAGFVSDVLGQTIPTIAEYVALGVPAMITYGAIHGANEAFRETGSPAAAAAGAIIGAAEAGAPAPFLHGFMGKDLIDGAVRGAIGMGIIGGLQTFADPIPRAIATGDYTAPTWEGVEQGVLSGAIGGALLGAFGAARNQRAIVIDPSKPPGETNTEVTANRAFTPVRPAAMEPPAEGGAPKFAADSTPAERIEHVIQNEGLSLEELENGHGFQDALDRLGETDPATVELAKGHDTAWAGLRYLRGLMGELLKDTQGSGPRKLTEGEKEELARQLASFGGKAVEPPAGEATERSKAEPQLPGGGGGNQKTFPPNKPTGLDQAQRELEFAASRRPREPRRPDSMSGEQVEPAKPFPDNTRANTNLMMDAMRMHSAVGEQFILHYSKMVDDTRVLLNPHMPEFQAAEGPAKMDTTIGHMIQDMEGRGEATVPGSGGKRWFAMLDPNSPLKPVIDLFRTVNTDLWLKIQERVARGDIDSVGYVKDYWRHLWKDPFAAEAAWGAGRQGSSASLKERTLPTIADGLAMGLELKIEHPADLMNYDVASKLKYLHHLDLVDHLEDKVGLVTRSERQPYADAVQLQGRSMDRGLGENMTHAWAPREAANLYNRQLETGWYAYPTTAGTYQKLMWLKNTSVGTYLIVPIFHSFVIAEQTLATGFHQAWSELYRGNVASAAWEAAKTVTVAPKMIEVYRAGREALDNYARMTGDATVQGLVEAGARYGKRQLPYQTGPQGIVKSWQENRGHVIEAATRELSREARETLGPEDQAAWARVAMFTPRVAGMAIGELSRVVTSTSAPLFDYAIPAMKAGVQVLKAKQFIDLNPTADEATVRTRMRQIVDNVEDRFGEMNQDNLFWNKWVKQTANVAMISTSWAYGSWRWFAGAAGYNLERGREWNPEATGSLISAAVVYVGANGVMNYLNTGERPKDVWDLLNFRTGGVTKTGGVQRGLIPTEFKELYDVGHIVVDAIMDPWSVPKGILHYFAGKENSVVQTMTALLTGEDAIGHKISWQPGGWGKYFADAVTPIIFKSIGTHPVGGGLNVAERLFIREAPMWVESTEAYFHQQEKLHDRWIKEETQRAGREAIQNGDAPPEGYKAPAGRGAGRGGGRVERDPARERNFSRTGASDTGTSVALANATAAVARSNSRAAAPSDTTVLRGGNSAARGSSATREVILPSGERIFTNARGERVEPGAARTGAGYRSPAQEEVSTEPRVVQPASLAGPARGRGRSPRAPRRR